MKNIEIKKASDFNKEAFVFLSFKQMIFQEKSRNFDIK